MILLLNDTSNYHSGCAEVVKNIQFDQSVKSVTRATADTLQHYKIPEGTTLIILNGEGTMHHNQPAALAWLEVLVRAQNMGIETWLVNSIWQEMDQTCADIIKRCTKVEVREILSHLALAEQGVDSKIAPDRSIRSDVSLQEREWVTVYKGQGALVNGHNTKIEGSYPEINIFKESWEDIVNKLRNADLLITGRHHEMYAAIKARCRFIIVGENSWKNTGLLQTCSELPMDITVQEALSGKWDWEYDKIFKWCNK
jgi:hypothetical protein